MCGSVRLLTCILVLFIMQTGTGVWMMGDGMDSSLCMHPRKAQINSMERGLSGCCRCWGGVSTPRTRQASFLLWPIPHP